MKRFIEEFGNGLHFRLSIVEWDKDNHEVAIMTTKGYSGNNWEINYDLMQRIFGVNDVMSNLSSMEVYGIKRDVNEYLHDNYPYLMGKRFFD